MIVKKYLTVRYSHFAKKKTIKKLLALGKKIQSVFYSKAIEYCKNELFRCEI